MQGQTEVETNMVANNLPVTILIHDKSTHRLHKEHFKQWLWAQKTINRYTLRNMYLYWCYKRDKWGISWWPTSLINYWHGLLSVWVTWSVGVNIKWPLVSQVVNIDKDEILITSERNGAQLSANVHYWNIFWLNMGIPSFNTKGKVLLLFPKTYLLLSQRNISFVMISEKEDFFFYLQEDLFYPHMGILFYFKKGIFLLLSQKGHYLFLFPKKYLFFIPHGHSFLLLHMEHSSFITIDMFPFTLDNSPVNSVRLYDYNWCVLKIKL